MSNVRTREGEEEMIKIILGTFIGGWLFFLSFAVIGTLIEDYYTKYTERKKGR